MEINNNKKENNTRFNYSSKESQKLFEEFTCLLSEITDYAEEREKRLQFLSIPTNKVLIVVACTFFRFLKKIIKTFKLLILSFFRRIVQYVSKLVNKLLRVHI